MLYDPSYLIGERDKHYNAYHKLSADWANATTELLLQPSSNTHYLITRIGFTAYDPSADFAQDIKIDFYDGKDWETRFEACNYAGLANVADRIESYKLGTKDVVSFFWHYSNGILVHGSLGEQLKVYPSALISTCDHFYFGCRYFEFA